MPKECRSSLPGATLRRARLSERGPEVSNTSVSLPAACRDCPSAITDDAAVVSAGLSRIAQVEAVDRPAALLSSAQRAIECGKAASVVKAKRRVIEPLDGCGGCA